MVAGGARCYRRSAVDGAGVVYALLSDGSDKGGSTGGGTRYSDLPERPD